MTTASALTKPAQIRVTRRSPAYWRVTIDNPPINVMGPEMVQEFQELIDALEADEHVRVVVFDSAVDDYFLNHSDFLAKLEDLTSMPAGPTGLPPWPDFLVRLTRLPVASIALIRGRATGNGSEITLACDMSFASREKAIISQWEVGVGMVAGGGPMARLPQLIGRNRALEVLLSSEDIRGEQAEAYGYVNRALPDAELDAFVEALATRIAKFDKWAIANTKRLVNTSLPPDVELGAGWDACIASLGRPAAQDGIKALMARGFHKPGDVENRLGYYLGQIARYFETEHLIYHEDAVLEYPQSGERFRGRGNIQSQRTNQPSKKRFVVRRIIGGGDLWVTELIITYDGKPSYTVSIMEFRGDKVARETQYFADPFVAPASRAQWVER
jgi:enoyl-CoA hydratase/carnithine racemase